ncbi:MAG: hypothetical protein IPP49_20250 [Saprospiraceae bacterium]|nr:hypothetical protein [Saprospiraceae bacterium]
MQSDTRCPFRQGWQRQEHRYQLCPILKLPAQIQSSVKEGQLSMGHARALAGVDNIALQLQNI